MSVVLGLTGSIATGKSTVSKRFIEQGIPVIDADVIAKEVVKIGQPAYEKIIQNFGKRILLENGEINRPLLGSVIFNDEEERKKLNNIVHPAVRKAMIDQKERYISKGKDIIVLDIPLLFESKLTGLVDKILVVYVNEDMQIERLQQRNKYNNEEAKIRIASQWSIEVKKELADYVIDNTGSIEKTNIQVDNLLNNLKNQTNF